ncbi:OmpW family outer membrane protein [Methylophilus sp. VKM B-3414]|jgi:outer membrane protein|uniref:OmpW/AlkL family protein n=1 Tax=Methylophilus sp. VKM B-3414 TaxID=3076121 RepID=UPI0028C82ACE|nr:OmpW family outer membrane protein [Methylophilus sp. VKM B-3414]MDT7850595.1 OmpW family outer membrane protein [Methylophilus sp. VKM B-3414]
MKKTAISLMLAALLPALNVQAEQGDWVVRLRAANIKPNEDSSLGKYVNRNVANVMTPSSELKVDSNTIPELDISYYWTKNIATELILALGTKHDVKITGDNGGVVTNQKLGEVDLLPPTLTAQWHFNPDATFDPYVGAGINATFMLDRYLRGSAGAIDGQKIRIDRDSFGPALQAGFDINLKDGWMINADVKYLWINTEVEMKSAALTGDRWTKIDKLDINPWVLGIGIGKRF